MTRAIYRAPAGDAEIVRLRGLRFVSGEPVELGPEHAAFIAKLRGNPHFEVEPEPETSGYVQNGPRAVHRGRGVYGIVDDGIVLDQFGAMTKEDAEAFNALSDEEKAAFVSKPADLPPVA